MCVFGDLGVKMCDVCVFGGCMCVGVWHVWVCVVVCVFVCYDIISF